MPHSFIKIWIHAVWATKERYPMIHPAIESRLHHEMRKQLIALGCPVRIIKGMPDHVHCLFLLNRENSIAEVIKQVKGSTSYWANEQNLIPDKFAWQTGYGAFSVSESQLPKVFQYIKNQKIHHAKTSFSKEFDELTKLHGLQEDLKLK